MLWRSSPLVGGIRSVTPARGEVGCVVTELRRGPFEGHPSAGNPPLAVPALETIDEPAITLGEQVPLLQVHGRVALPEGDIAPDLQVDVGQLVLHERDGRTGALQPR